MRLKRGALDAWAAGLYNEAAARVGWIDLREGNFSPLSGFFFFSPFPRRVALNKKRLHIIVDYRDTLYFIMHGTFENVPRSD